MTNAGRMRSGRMGAVEEGELARETRTERSRRVLRMDARSDSEPVLGEKRARTSTVNRDQPELVSRRGILYEASHRMLVATNER